MNLMPMGIRDSHGVGAGRRKPGAMSGKIISVHSFRGGTGKSNLAANLSCGVAARGKRVAVIDTDIQSPGIHVLFRQAPSGFKFALNDFLQGRCAIEDTAVDVTHTLDYSKAPVAEDAKVLLIPSSIRVGEIAQILNEGYDVGRLNDGIQEVIQRLELDYLFIDTHPGVNEETLLSIAISDNLLIVLRPDQQDFQGTSVTVELARQLEVSNMHLVLNKMLTVMNAKAFKERAESIFKTPVAQVLPLSEELIQLGSDGVFSLMEPEHPYSKGIEALVDLVI
jgi:MinD-like ATPase involved in chromosome partitioning or flagellar assembly